MTTKEKIVEILEKHFGTDNNFIVTTKSKRYDLIANEILGKKNSK